MKDTDIILKALKLANDKGYNTYYADGFSKRHEVDIGGMYLTDGVDNEETVCIREIIFDPEFAIALWGERTLCNECGEFEEDCDLHIWEHYKIAWQYHVQRMVIMEKPLEYLEKFVK